MSLVPSDPTLKDQLGFEYSVRTFTDEELSLNFFFENPTSVSSYEKDTLVFKLDNFRDREGSIIYDNFEIRKKMPRQASPAAVEVAESAGAAASAAVGASTSVNLVLNILLSGSLNQMLSSIKNLQVIVHLTLLTVNRPAITKPFFSKLFEMISFDPINIEDQITAIFSLPDESDDEDEESDDDVNDEDFDDED